MDREDLGVRIARLARLGRQRDFSLPRFRNGLERLERHAERGEILRQLLAEWTGLPFETREAERRWLEIERRYMEMRRKLGAPLGLQTILLHYFHTVSALLKEPRLLSERDLSVLRVNAITDPLTGLYNRRFLLEHLEREIARAERSHGIVSVVLMDLKGFKNVNDRLGHPVGDSVLVRTARVIRDSLRTIDAGCRWGGDEFVLVLPNTDLIIAFAVAERVRKRVSASALPASTGLAMGVHYGVAAFPTDGKTVAFLLKVADLRLYQCRAQSNFSGEERRNHPRFAADAMNLRLQARRSGRPWTAEVLDVSYGGVAFRSTRRVKPLRYTAEIFQRNESERHPVRVRPVHSASLPDGGVVVGCSYV